jgi:phosphoribosylanthranilate isomerase
MMVKICGITRLEDARLAVSLGASAIGFVFWPASPRFLHPSLARDLVRELPDSVLPVGVFVNQPLAHVIEVACRVGLGAVQLHGRETPEYCASLPCHAIKAIPVVASTERAVWLPFPRCVTMLVDEERHGGTGRRADWAVARLVAEERRTILAGGLAPDNVAAAIETVSPYGVDVSSGVESRPGIKDPSLLEAFFSTVRGLKIEGA